MRYLSGVQPNGRLHLGNYFGAIQNHIRLQEEGECFWFIANYHALTTVQDAKRLEADTFAVAADYLALGLDPAKALLFRQSDVPEVTELAWLLASVTGMGLLERAHSYKDKTARGIVPSVGLFTYPVLMAADILIYRSDKVPVGGDQVQHVEMARDMAGYFNRAFGREVLKLPEVLLGEESKVPGLTGGKMSKSAPESVVPIFGEEKEIRKRIMAMVTDSKGVHEPKDPEASPIWRLYRLVASPEESQEMAEGFRKGGLGYGEAKKRLADKLEERFGGELRERRRRLDAEPDRVEEVLEASARKARRAAVETLEAALEAAGIPRSRIRKQMFRTE